MYIEQQQTNTPPGEALLWRAGEIWSLSMHQVNGGLMKSCQCEVWQEQLITNLHLLSLDVYQDHEFCQKVMN